MKEESRRPKRVGSLLREALGPVIGRELRGAATSLVTVTRVEVQPDLKTARVFVSVFGPDDPAAVLAYLERRAGSIRRLLASSVKLKYNPQLFFALDQSAEISERIERILDAAKKDEPDTR